MKVFIIFFFLLVLDTSFALELYSSADKKSGWSIQNYRDIALSAQACKMNCIAKEKVDAFFKKSSVFQFDYIKDRNPTSLLCNKLGGKAEIYFEKDDSEISVCVFKDKSFLRTWDLLKQ